jgi:hypothetical protein
MFGAIREVRCRRLPINHQQAALRVPHAERRLKMS